MVQIGELAYKTRFDGRELTRGLMSTRSQMTAAKKIAEESRRPIDRYRTGLENLASMSKRYSHVAEKQVELSARLERQYLEEEKAVRRLTKAERQRLELLQLPDAIKARSAMPDNSRQRQAEADRRAGLARQSFLQGIDVQQEQGRAGLRERLNRFKQTGRTDLENRRRSPIFDEFAAAEHFGRFSSSGRSGSGGGMSSASMLSPGLKAAAGIAAAAAAYKAASAMRELAAGSAESFAQLERNNVALEVFTGSAAKAHVMMSDMRKLSATSGISVSALAQSAAAMMSYGVTAENTSKKLREMAILSRGDSERFKMMALAFGQVTAAGRLMGQEVLQLVNAGFNPLVEISKNTGRSMADLRKDMAEGLLSVDLASQSFTTAAASRIGLVEKLAETTAGALAKNNAAWDEAKTKIGQALAPLTRFKAMLSTKLASDFGAMADAVSGGSSVAPDSPADRKKLYEEQRRNRNQEALATERARVAAAFETEKQRLSAQKTSGLDSLTSMTAAALQGSVDSPKTAAEMEAQKFARLLTLMDDVSKQRAIQDFAENRNLESLYTLLDREVLLELKKLEVLEDQVRAREKEAEMAAKGKEVAAKYASPEQKLRDSILRTQQMLKAGVISPDIAAKEQAAAGQQFGQDVAAQRATEKNAAIVQSKLVVEKLKQDLASNEAKANNAQGRLSAVNRIPLGLRNFSDRNILRENADSANLNVRLAKSNLAAAQEKLNLQLAESAGIRPQVAVNSIQAGSQEFFQYMDELKRAANKSNGKTPELTELEKQTVVENQLLGVMKEIRDKTATVKRV